MDPETKQDQNESSDLKFLSDKPSSSDALGIHRSIAASLKKIILGDSPKPFVVGLYGPWGSGKSSIVEMLGNSANEEFQIVVIDAWRKDKKNFLRQFIKKVAQTLCSKVDYEDIRKKIDYKESTQNSNWIPGKKAKATLYTFMFISLAFILGEIWFWWRTREYTQYETFPLKDIGSIGFLILIAAVFQWLVPKHSRKTDISTQEITVDDPAWFRELYFDILGRTKKLPICIVIDNLDRVQADDSLAIIKFLKTFVVDNGDGQVTEDGPQITFLIPCDDQRLLNRINESEASRGYTHVGSDIIPNGISAAPDASDFLRKFVNVALRIPHLLPHDNTAYIRSLIRETRIHADNNILENMTFTISRFSENNPRKPKNLLNDFVARYNLAMQFPFCHEIIHRRPDWFLLYCLIEFKFPNMRLADHLEPNQRMSENVGIEFQPMGPTGAVRHILEEITVATWRTFQFLKKPNIQELVPKFNDLVNSALNRQITDFSTALEELLPKHPQVINDLWSERQDSSGRMAFAECLLSAREKHGEIILPPYLLGDIANMIQGNVTGWTRLPAVSTYELVIKQRRDCLNSVVTYFNSSAIDESKPSKDFMHTILSRVMQDFHRTGEFQKEIHDLLENRARKDIDLVHIAVNYPEYKSGTVFRMAAQAAIERVPHFSVEGLARYLERISQLDATLRDALLGDLEKIIENSFEAFQTEVETRLGVFEFSSRFLAYFAKNNSYMSPDFTRESRIFRALIGQYSFCWQNRFWEGMFYILSADIEICQSALDPTHTDEAQTHFKDNISDFARLAPDNWVVRLVKEYGDFIHKSEPQVALDFFDRSPQLAGVAFEHFPQIRPQIISQLLSTQPNWVKQVAAEIADSDLNLREAFGVLLVTSIGENPSDELYKVIRDLGGNGPNFKKALENHFNARVNPPNGLSVTQLESVLRAMQLSAYKPTDGQVVTLRGIKDSIPVQQFTDQQRELFGEFFVAARP